MNVRLENAEIFGSVLSGERLCALAAWIWKDVKLCFAPHSYGNCRHCGSCFCWYDFV